MRIRGERRTSRAAVRACVPAGDAAMNTPTGLTFTIYDIPYRYPNSADLSLLRKRKKNFLVKEIAPGREEHLYEDIFCVLPKLCRKGLESNLFFVIHLLMCKALVHTWIRTTQSKLTHTKITPQHSTPPEM